MKNKELNKKDLGLVVTPQKTADYIVSRLGLIINRYIVLDPCVGPGVFVKSLIKSGVNRNQIFSYDINPIYKKHLEKQGISFKVIDILLSMDSGSFNEFNFIVGNPPYLNKASNYIRKNKVQLRKIYGKINAHETYSMFIVNCIWRLKEGGKLGFITSDSYLTLITHKKLRKFILENCLINEILLAPKDLFANQGVNTIPAIIILTKCTGKNNKEKRKGNLMKIIPRIKNEDQYLNPPIIYEIEQKKYHSLPFNLFFIDVELQIIKLFEGAPKIKNYIKGYIGMHTHNNKKYLAAVEGTDLAKIFNKKNLKISNPDEKFKIISNKELNSKRWKPYLKRGGGDQYYRPIMEAINWEKDSIQIYDIPKNVPFEHEGIVISGVSSRLAARYMPQGFYWDSNKAIGFIIEDDSLTINYLLGLLNSSLYNYLAKGIINNTSSIQITGIHALPFIIPDNTTKEKVEEFVKEIIERKKKDINYDYRDTQKLINDIIYDFYAKRFNFPIELKRKLDEKYSIN